MAFWRKPGRASVIGLDEVIDLIILILTSVERMSLLLLSVD